MVIFEITKNNLRDDVNKLKILSNIGQMGNYTNYILSKLKLLNDQNELIKNIDVLNHVIKRMLFKNQKTLKDFYEQLKLILHDKKGVNLSLEHIEIFKEIFKRSLYFKDKAFI